MKALGHGLGRCVFFSVSGAVDLRRGLIELFEGPADNGEIGMLFTKELI